MACEQPRKRRIEDDDFHNEERDAFDADGGGTPIRGRKAARRVSGVARLEKSLYNIGGNVTVMSMVLQRLSMKNLLQLADISPFWLTCMYQELRQRFKDTPIIRLWNTDAIATEHLWINWELHFHEQLLTGNELSDASMEKPSGALEKNMRFFPDVEAIISIGSRQAWSQFTHDEAKLPVRQDHIFMICNHAIITTPDFTFTGEFTDSLNYNALMVQSLLLPKSKDVAFKAWGLGCGEENWDLEKVRGKIEFPKEDVGPGQELQAIVVLHYTPHGSTIDFNNSFRENYKTVGLLAGFAEEVGTNRFMEDGLPWAVGMSIYASAAARAAIYEVDYEEEKSEDVLREMQQQTETFANSFCFVCWHDTRVWEEKKDPDGWDEAIRPPERIEGILKDLRQRLPKTPIFGVKSLSTITTKVVEDSNSNIGEKSSKNLVSGFLLVTWNANSK